MRQEPNNEMDLLLRRLGRREGAPLLAEVRIDEHLDADELSSYAAKALPAAARARYTEHLAECSSCRMLVAQLSVSEGSAVAVQDTSSVSEPSGFKKFLGSLLSPMVLRYAVPAVGVIAIIAVGLVVMRREPAGDFLAQRAEPKLERAAAQPTLSQTPAPGVFADEKRAETTASPQSRTAKAGEVASETKTTGDTSAEQPRALDRVTKQDAPAVGQEQPVTNTPPPAPKLAVGDLQAQRQELEKKKQAGEADQTAAARNESPQRASEPSKEEQRKSNEIAVAAPSSAARGRTQELRRAKSADAAGSTENFIREDAKDKDGAETRSVAGRRFRKNGGVWVDTVYDSSREVINVARGSEQYRALVADEPAIRTIAEQLLGEIIVVWKGRVYRIR